MLRLPSDCRWEDTVDRTVDLDVCISQPSSACSLLFLINTLLVCQTNLVAMTRAICDNRAVRVDEVKCRVVREVTTSPTVADDKGYVNIVELSRIGVLNADAINEAARWDWRWCNVLGLELC
jgi:hypothetical protein